MSMLIEFSTLCNFFRFGSLTLHFCAAQATYNTNNTKPSGN